VRRYRFPPRFAYDGLDRKWDALLIEGYSGPATSVIRQVRRLNPNIVVAHWALDTRQHGVEKAFHVDSSMRVEARLKSRSGQEIALPHRYPSLAAVAALPVDTSVEVKEPDDTSSTLAQVDAWLTNSRVVATGGFEAAARALELPLSGWFAEADRRPRSWRPASRKSSQLVFLAIPAQVRRARRA